MFLRSMEKEDKVVVELGSPVSSRTGAGRRWFLPRKGVKGGRVDADQQNPKLSIHV